MLDTTNNAPALNTSVEWEDAKQRLTHFINEKAKALEAGCDTAGPILDFLSDGLPLCVRMLSEADPHRLESAIELIDAAQAELAAAVQAREFLIDAKILRELNLVAAITMNHAYTCLNAIDDCLYGESFTTTRFAVKTYKAYAERYEELMTLISSLPRNAQVATLLEETGYYHAMVAMAEANLANHIDWLKAKHPSKRLQ